MGGKKKIEEPKEEIMEERDGAGYVPWWKEQQ